MRLALPLPQRLHEYRVLCFPLRVQPLLDLVEDDQHFLADRDGVSLPLGCQRLLHIEFVGQVGSMFEPHPLRKTLIQRGWLATTKECHSTIVPYARKVRSSTSERL